MAVCKGGYVGADFPKIVNDNRTVVNAGGSLTWFACIILALLIIHFSCGSGVATGYVGDVCARGLNVWDYLGIVCCAPVYVLFLILTSGGLRIW
jgi:hypothetical protein